MAKSKSRQLAEIMKKRGATSTPNEQTYVATAQEQAMAGDQKAANETMQYSVQNPAAQEIDAQEEQKMRDNDPKTDKKYKEYLKALAKAKKKAE